MSSLGVKSAAEMLRRGGTLVKEACIKCNGVQVRYQGRLICINCGNEMVLDEGKGISLSNLEGIIVEKVNEISSALRSESDIARQMDMAKLLIYYLEILAKIKEKGAEKIEDGKKETIEKKEGKGEVGNGYGELPHH